MDYTNKAATVGIWDNMTQNKKILHIITGLNDGGAEAVLYRLCGFDNRCRHSVISLMDSGKYGPLLREAGIPVCCLGMEQGRVNIKGWLRLWQILLRERPRVVQTWMYHADLVGGIIARMAGVDNICWGVHHSNAESSLLKKTTCYVAKFCGIISRFIPRKIVCCANKSLENHTDIGYVKNKMIVINNGIDLRRFQPDIVARNLLRSEWEIDDSMPLIGMVARYHPLKDHKSLIDALSILNQSNRQFRCVLIGNDISSENDCLKGWIDNARLQEKVILLGQRTDIPSVMNALDIHVLSSTDEAFPNVLAEAMACGTPCVATDVGDVKFIIADFGWVVPSANPRMLALSIAEALSELNESATWAERSEAARKHIMDNFSLESMVQAYHDVWFVKQSAKR